MKDSEHQEQVKIFQWAAYLSGQHPELNLLFAIPNGGQRNIIVATKLKQEGVKRGVPDMFLPVPKWPYYGLFIELKAGNNKPSTEQCEWLDRLAQQHYRAAWCRGAEDAIQHISDYLGLPPTEMA